MTVSHWGTLSGLWMAEEMGALRVSQRVQGLVRKRVLGRVRRLV